MSASCPANCDNPLLSEFADYPIIQRCLSYKWLWLPAALYLCGAIIAAVLSYYADSHCVKLVVRDSGNKVLADFKYGYLAEPNHGPFYLVMMPMFIALATFFLLRTQTVFQELARANILVFHDADLSRKGGDSERYCPAAIEKLAHLNRFVFTAILWVLPALSLGIILGTELPVLKMRWPGWVQGGNIGTYHGQDLKSFDDPFKSRASEIIQGRFAGQNLNNAGGGQAAGCKVYVDWPKAISPYSSSVFPWFVAVALALESIAIAICSYFGLKILFILFIMAIKTEWLDKDDHAVEAPIATDLAGEQIPRYRIYLDYFADDSRFGIGRLDEFFNSALTLAVLISALAFIGNVSNVSRGLEFSFKNPQMFAIGRLLLPACALLVAMAIVVHPIRQFLRRVAGKRDEKILALRGRQDISNARRTELIQKVCSQSLWPSLKNSSYTRMLLACLALTMAAIFGMEIEKLWSGSQAIAEKVADLLLKISCLNCID